MDVYQRRRLVALSILAVLFIAFVLLIRSCGGDDEPAPAVPVSGATGVGGATALTLAAYVEQADAACLDANNSLASVDETDPVAAARENAQTVAGELEALQALPAPEDAPAGLEDFQSALQTQAGAYQNLAKALERGDDVAATELQTQIDEAAADAQDAADQVGLDVCGDTSKTGDSDGGTGASGGGDETTGSVETGGVTTTTPAAPVTPAAPSEGGVTPVTPAPAPAPAPADGGDSGTGGITP